MKNVTVVFLKKLAEQLEKLAERDMREWPPTSVPIYYQPQRPREKDDNKGIVNSK